MPLVQQPKYSPELNLAERVNEEMRRLLKGKTFRRLADKVLAVEQQLRYWKAHPAIIQRLCGYPWIRDGFDLLDQVAPMADEQVVSRETKMAA